jgi:hypothetical protein
MNTKSTDIDRQMTKVEELTATMGNVNHMLNDMETAIDNMSADLFGVPQPEEPSKVEAVAPGQLHQLTQVINYSSNKATDVLNKLAALKEML